ncbi:hypothetical protein BG011_001463 [Mortierella polycephala]|uniref:2Fe-2S ferredoxin-type domain-containing protein n=1 Tax=Mortierella polycephala TaxID=41804 RepID=A0A9P6U542_9FUNG|nr:hypothetical protein BG011_001463 [Mortierella polycephala]
MASILASVGRRAFSQMTNTGKVTAGSVAGFRYSPRSFIHPSTAAVVPATMLIRHKIAQFSTTSGVQYASKGRPGPGEGFQVNFVLQDGEEISLQAHEGESLLDVAWANDIDIEGACEASLACSTCHLILDENSYSKLEEPTDEENDMLDLAFGLTDTSRLGCQVLMSKELDGVVAKIPTVTRNAQL